VSPNPTAFAPGVALFRSLLRFRLRAKGYSADQAKRIVGKIGDGQILEWLAGHAGSILKLIQMILPFILMFADEPPAGPPVPELDEPDDD